MKKLTLIVTIAVTTLTAIIASVSDAGQSNNNATSPQYITPMYLKEGAMYASTKQDMEAAVRCGVDGDTAALAEMAMQGRISLPTTERKPAFLVHAGLFDGYVEFRLKGSSRTYWTLSEWLGVGHLRTVVLL